MMRPMIADVSAAFDLAAFSPSMAPACCMNLNPAITTIRNAMTPAMVNTFGKISVIKSATVSKFCAGRKRCRMSTPCA